MNYYKKLAVSRALGIGPGDLFIMSELGDECIYRLSENGLEIRIGTCWYPSVQMEDILSGKLGDIVRFGGM